MRIFLLTICCAICLLNTAQAALGQSGRAPTGHDTSVKPVPSGSSEFPSEKVARIAGDSVVSIDINSVSYGSISLGPLGESSRGARNDPLGESSGRERPGRPPRGGPLSKPGSSSEGGGAENGSGPLPRSPANQLSASSASSRRNESERRLRRCSFPEVMSHRVADPPG